MGLIIIVVLFSSDKWAKDLCNKNQGNECKKTVDSKKFRFCFPREMTMLVNKEIGDQKHRKQYVKIDPHPSSVLG
jgi:hypothetical protein